MIEVENLTKFYGPARAIQDVSFTVEPGEILGFLGPNAAGKTTTMRILAGYIPPTSGTARICGHDVLFDSLAARRNIGYLPESVPLYTEMTVRSYLEFFARLRGVRQVATAVERVVALCGLEGKEGEVIGRLSRGYRQRVGLAQALVHDPPVLILDEPTVGLDPRQIAEVRSLIRSLGGSHTIILSTHILPEASQVCSRVLIINNGRIVAEDRPERLAARVRGEQQILLQLGRPEPESERLLRSIRGVRSVSRDGQGRYRIACEPGAECRPAVAELCVQRGWQLLELRTQDVTLEEVFLRLTEDTVPIPEVQA